MLKLVHVMAAWEVPIFVRNVNSLFYLYRIVRISEYEQLLRSKSDFLGILTIGKNGQSIPLKTDESIPVKPGESEPPKTDESEPVFLVHI